MEADLIRWTVVHCAGTIYCCEQPRSSCLFVSRLCLQDPYWCRHSAIFPGKARACKQAATCRSCLQTVSCHRAGKAVLHIWGIANLLGCHLCAKRPK